MNDMHEMKEEWREMMEKKQKMDDMMKGMAMDGMGEMKAEWNKLTEEMNKIQDMMQ